MACGVSRCRRHYSGTGSVMVSGFRDSYHDTINHNHSLGLDCRVSLARQCNTSSLSWTPPPLLQPCEYMYSCLSPDHFDLQVGIKGGLLFGRVNNSHLWNMLQKDGRFCNTQESNTA